MDHIEILRLLKERKDEENRQMESKKIILIERVQVNTNNPAIAELRITFPISAPPKFFIDYYKERKKNYAISANVHKILEISDREFVLTIEGVLPMYKWMEYFITCVIRDFQYKGYTIRIKGCWEKYNGRNEGDYPVNCVMKTSISSSSSINV